MKFCMRPSAVIWSDYQIPGSGLCRPQNEGCQGYVSAYAVSGNKNGRSSSDSAPMPGVSNLLGMLGLVDFERNGIDISTIYGWAQISYRRGRVKVKPDRSHPFFVINDECLIYLRSLSLIHDLWSCRRTYIDVVDSKLYVLQR